MAKLEQLYELRVQRISDARVVKEPDKVPCVNFATAFYPTIQMGITNEEAMYSMKKTAKAFIKVFKDSNIDCAPAIIPFSGQVFDDLGVQYFAWPGAADETRRLKAYQPFQFVENEYMKASEYEEYFQDPTGFLLRKIIPRHYKNLEGFSLFPASGYPIGNGYMSMTKLAMYFGSQNMPLLYKFIMYLAKDKMGNMFPGKESIKALGDAAVNSFKSIIPIMRYPKKMKKYGYPVFNMSITQAPFDAVSEYFRGLTGSMTDMYRHPEELKKILDLQVESAIQVGIEDAEMRDAKIVFVPLHRGADGFMSNKQFEEFYWPTLVKVMEGLIKKDLMPMPFFEGGYNERLSYLQEFAKKNRGKVLYYFDKTDMSKAKEMFGDYVCLRGNVPGSLLVSGTPAKVEEYVKDLIENCSSGGGLIVDGGVAGIPDESRFENVKAMIDATNKYGIYRK
jgi:uroporphyrinogen-III decarboxylase